MVGSTWNQKREDLGSRWISPSSSVCLGEVPELLEPEQPQLSDTFMVGKRVKWGFPGGSDGKKSAAVQETDSIPGSGRSLGEGNGYPLQYSCLEHSMDRGAWWAIVHRVAKSRTQLSD